ncbi:MAG TPA: HU family DNA-binding protein [Mycobacteriales bacterium]|nr:HU family DNA-binding protein [Mycobacteriales bacterium]
MNRAELVQALAQQSGQPKEAVEQVLGALGDVVGEALTSGEKVSLPGLLTAERVERAERQGRNPQTGESMTIPAGHAVKLTAVSSLKAQVRGR